MHRWKARFRLDHSEAFETDSQCFDLETSVLSEAAEQIESLLGGSVTLIELQRMV